MKKAQIIILTASISLGIYSCEHEAPEVEPEVTDTKSEETVVTDFTYTEDTVFIAKGDSAVSSTPTFTSGSDVVLELTSTPDALGAITIDNNGTISIDSSIKIGIYVIDINTTNDKGSKLYLNALSVKVTEKNIVEEIFTTYNLDVKPILSQHCFSCHPSYNDYTKMTFLIDNILDRTQREQNSSGFMPKGRDALSEEEISILKNWKSDGLKE